MSSPLSRRSRILMPEGMQPHSRPGYVQRLISGNGEFLFDQNDQLCRVRLDAKLLDGVVKVIEVSNGHFPTRKGSPEFLGKGLHSRYAPHRDRHQSKARKSARHELSFDIIRNRPRSSAVEQPPCKR